MICVKKQTSQEAPIRWLGHITRNENGRMSKELICRDLLVNRGRGRPRVRPQQQVDEDLRRVGDCKESEGMEKSHTSLRPIRMLCYIQGGLSKI